MIESERYALSITGFCGHTDYDNIRNNYFAKMIVDTCLNVCNTHSQGERNEYFQAARRIHDDIQQIFGLQL